MTYTEEIKKLFDLQKFGMKFGLDNMRDMLNKLDKPEQGQIFVHVAGTNGKGSTAAILASILAAAGRRTGLYTSPHLVTFRERIRLNDQLIEENEVLRLSRKIWPLCRPDSPPTFFEFVTAMAFIYFKERRADLSVIEAGLGGRLDSTNVISPLACAITSISLEHTDYLGETLEEIAKEKAGVIKPGRPVVLGRVTPEVLRVMETAARERVSSLFVLDRDFSINIKKYDVQGRPIFDYAWGGYTLDNLLCGLSGPHQAENAALAITLARILCEHGYRISESDIRRGLERIAWPGRSENFFPGGWPITSEKALAPLILDGAHNPAGALRLAQMLKVRRYKRLHLIVGVMADKDVAGVLKPLVQMADCLYLTRPEFHRAADPALLLKKLQEASALSPSSPCNLFPTLPEALQAAAREAEADDLVVLSGSLFTVGEARSWLLGLPAVESN